ncbi:MAG: SRPBCC domain-containing protein [Candidatus Zixiibacteriota bacterium]|nr:MAG: SRPBCC domain-containing protein [candidate division Zixibacteria bacterium]
MKITNITSTSIVLLTVCAVMLISMATAADEGEAMSDQKEQFFVQLLGTREGWPNDMTPGEEQIMTEHYHYLEGLVKQGKVITAGPVFDPVFGLIIVKAASKAEARALIEKDPSVTAGLHTFEIHPMRVSLLVENFDEDRYVKNPTNRRLTKEVLVDAVISEVYRAWTTSEGVRTFFAPDAKVELWPGGAYEMYFSPGEPEGLRGSDGCRVLSFLPSSMFSFEWNAPVRFGPLRDVYTQVVIMFEELDTGETRVTLTQHGWGEGEDWDELHDYFDGAWTYVLENLKKRFTTGPVDWSSN